MSGMQPYVHVDALPWESAPEGGRRKEVLRPAIEELPADSEPGASSTATIHASGTDRAPEWKLLEPTKGPRLRYRRLIDVGVEVIAGLCEIDPATHYSRHYHDQPEVYYVLAGEGVVWVGDALVEVAPGSALYLGPRVVHGADSVGHEPLRMFYVYGCESAGHGVNWTPVEDLYTEPRARAR